ncbi:MAG TPA: radical SAM protein, partial [bacterium (Candidatus Stahlbacteria)]|nr:radical SAM protein [Candidatus Stahlbacteria bacterium]
MFDAIWHDQQSRRDFFKACASLAAISFAIGHAQEYGKVDPREASYYRSLADGRIKCLLCPQGCTVPKGRRGLCRVRENRNGKYYTLAYGNPCAIHLDPIEKKPLFHFLPGTTALSIATAGCNFSCRYCQNWQISQTGPEDTI